jgi:F-type H+-transporting ATPase subunit a
MIALFRKGSKSFKNLAVIALFLTAPTLIAKASSSESDLEEKFSPSEMIMHHIQDTHEFHLWGELAMPLPIILWTDHGLDIFMSGGFYHDDGTITTNKGSYELHHEKIYYVNTGEEGHAGKPLDFSITRNVFSLLLSFTLIAWIFISIANSYKKRGTAAPKGMQSLFEPIIIYVRDEIVKPNVGEKKYATYLPYLLTLFFFIWINNMIGLVPFFPGGSNLSGNIAFTFTLSILTFLIVQFSANKAYWKHIFWMPGVPVPVRFILAPIELLGTVSKAFALMIRLFANITGGHIVVLSLASMVFLFKSYVVGGVVTPFILFIMVLELMVAAIQAYVFTLLTSLFIGMAVADDDHH